MPFEFAAFLSYSHRDKAWVEILQEHLQASLEALGHEPSKVFRDDTDIGPGRSWVTGLQQGLDRARVVILVATPESMASPRVGDEWEAKIAQHDDWKRGRLQVVQLVDCPLPPFLQPIQAIDFREHDDTKYERGLRELLAGIRGDTDRRNLPELPSGLTPPAPPRPAVPVRLRREIVAWLKKQLESGPTVRTAVSSKLDLGDGWLDEHSSWECAASAALVTCSRRDDDQVEALGRCLETLLELREQEDPAAAKRLRRLREELDLVTRSGGLEQVWLNTVVSDHGRLERYFQRESDLDLLARVHVELEVTPDLARGAGDMEGTELLHRSPTELSELLKLEPGSPPRVTGRWLLLGDPGAGKTSLLRHLAASLGREDSPPWVPVYESLPDLLRAGDPLPQRLERRLRRAGHEAGRLPALCQQWAKDGRLLLLLDGLDEVPREARGEAEKHLRDLASVWPMTPMVVASRPIGYRPPGGGFTEVRLLPLDLERRRELLARWLGREAGEPDWARADGALEVLEADRSLWELSGNPLYLTLMAMLLEEEESPDPNPTRLYEQIFALLMDGKHRRDPEPMEAREATREVLRRLAFGMTTDNRDAEPLGRLEDRLLEKELNDQRERLERVPRWRPRLGLFFEDLAERTGILGPHDGEEADWRYWHRTFREALTAERLEEIAGEEGMEAVLERARAITGEEDESRWAEAFALLTGRVDEPDRLVRDLVEAKRPLGLRALASARTLKPETVPEILGLTGDVAERSKVYAELPRLLPDGRALLALVDRLRRETRDGNDLFWLDWVARQVGRQEEELGREVNALLARFFDHIPAPPRELFAHVEIPEKGRVPLWPEIPAGTFLMGSPEDEKEGLPDERPQHRVNFTSGFQMAAVPVTWAQYAAFDPGHKSYSFPGIPAEELAHHPVNGVTWYAAVAFCRWLGQAVPELAGARLPTEAEWEHACRAGSETAYWSGDGEAALREVGWYDGNSDGRTHRVGELPANPWGLHDVHGNVFEWTLGRWTEDYTGRADGVEEDPRAVSVEAAIGDDPGGGRRVVRGGSFQITARRARSAYRSWDLPRFVHWFLGFRVALPAAPSSRG